MKITTKENFRVEITPKTMFFRGMSQERYEELANNDCKNIVEQVKRHVDDVQYAEIKFDVKETCSFCFRNWDISLDDNEPEWPKGMPLCCNKAIEEFKNLKK